MTKIATAAVCAPMDIVVAGCSSPTTEQTYAGTAAAFAPAGHGGEGVVLNEDLGHNSYRHGQ